MLPYIAFNQTTSFWGGDNWQPIKYHKKNVNKKAKTIIIPCLKWG